MSRRIKIFADGADLGAMLDLYRQGIVQGFTTNPTLMRKAGVRHYEEFARLVLTNIPDLPVSFEVFSDDFAEMRRQALTIASWGDNVYVKVPITNTKGESSAELIAALASAGVKLNVTAVMTVDQVVKTVGVLQKDTPAIVSVFAGRIADTGIDPVPIMCESKRLLAGMPAAELLWASCREVFNVVQAEQTGCRIITVTPDILKKLTILGKPLAEMSLETVRMFYEDARCAGFSLDGLGSAR